MHIAKLLTENRWEFYKENIDKSSIIFDEEFNSWFIFNVSNFSQLLKNVNLSTKKKTSILDWPIADYEKKELMKFYNGWLMFMEGDEHRLLKKKVNQYLNEKANTIVFPEVALDLENYFSVKESISIPYVNSIMCQVMGINLDDYQQAITMTEKINTLLLKGNITIEDIEQCVYEIQKSYLFLEQIETKYKNDTNFVGNYFKGISREKRYPLLINLFSDGYAPFVSSLNYLIFNSVTNSQKYESFLDLNQIEYFTSESLRLFPSFTTISRIVKNDFSYNNYLFKKNQNIIFDLVSINRDGDVYSYPNEINIENYNRRATFGKGNHFCSGAPLVTLSLNNFLKSVGKKINEWNPNNILEINLYGFLDIDFDLVRKNER